MGDGDVEADTGELLADERILPRTVLYLFVATGLVWVVGLGLSLPAILRLDGRDLVGVVVSEGVLLLVWGLVCTAAGARQQLWLYPKTFRLVSRLTLGWEPVRETELRLEEIRRLRVGLPEELVRWHPPVRFESRSMVLAERSDGTHFGLTRLSDPASATRLAARLEAVLAARENSVGVAG